ncbi:MAG TPA: gamma-glutamyl-gamma-aminobutyrate hydrolase family protein, partial [Candidatus Limnocylindrales bacterium]
SDTARRKNELYADAVRRHGGEPLLLDATASEAERREAFGAMEGLLLSGGADVDPARYGRSVDGAVDVQRDRDALEAAAFAAAEARDRPVLGICRGFQALNVFLGGRLVQDVGGHMGPSYGSGPALRHALRIVPGTRLARILFPTNVGGGRVEVNSYHHQAVRADDLAPALVANAFATSPLGELVEGAETRGGRLVMGVQCHPERRESTPPSFERLFRVFVDASRGAAVKRSA